MLTLVGLFLLQVTGSLFNSVNALNVGVYKQGFQELEKEAARLTTADGGYDIADMTRKHS